MFGGNDGKAALSKSRWVTSPLQDLMQSPITSYIWIHSSHPLSPYQPVSAVSQMFAIPWTQCKLSRPLARVLFVCRWIEILLCPLDKLSTTIVYRIDAWHFTRQTTGTRCLLGTLPTLLHRTWERHRVMQVKSGFIFPLKSLFGEVACKSYMPSATNVALNVILQSHVCIHTVINRVRTRSERCASSTISRIPPSLSIALPYLNLFLCFFVQCIPLILFLARGGFLFCSSSCICAHMVKWNSLLLFFQHAK